MKIATFNVNNINKRLDNLIAWRETAQPDVVCLQELKAEQKAFPAKAFRDLGYRAVKANVPYAAARAAADVQPIAAKVKSVHTRCLLLLAPSLAPMK